MTEYLTTNLFVDEEFSWSDDWDEETQTFSLDDIQYKAGVNAFTDFNDAIANKGAGTAKMVIGYPVSEMGDYDNGTPISWDGTLVISSLDDTLNEQGAWSINGALVVDSLGEFAFGAMAQQGSMHITNGSTVTLAYHLGAAYNRFTNLVIDCGARLRDSGRLGAGFTLSGNSTIHGSCATAGSYDSAVSLSSVKESILESGSSLNLVQGASAQFGQFALQQGSTLALASSQFTVTKKLTICDGSTISLDADSFLKVNGKTINNGTIVVDATGFIGYKKIIDLSGITQPENIVQVTNAADNVTALHLDDGDLILTTADMSKLKVNSAWAGAYELGDALDSSGDFIYGVNAHETYANAYAMAQAKSPNQNIIIDSGTAVMDQSNTLTDIAVQNGANLQVSGDVDFGKTASDATFVIEAGGTLSGSDARLTLRGNSTLSAQGSDETAAVIAMAAASGNAGDIILADSATFNADNSTMSLGVLIIDSDTASLSISDSDVTLATALEIGTSTSASGLPMAIFNNTTLALNSIEESANYGSIALTNASSMDITFNNSDETAFTNYGHMALSGQSSLQTSLNLANKGDISLDNASLTTGQNMTNSGTLTAKASALTAHGNLDSTGKLDFTDTTLTVDGTVNSQSTFILTNSQAHLNQLNLQNGSFTATDSILTTTKSLDNDTTLSLSNIQTTISLDLINDGTLVSDNSTIAVTRNLINNKSFTATHGTVTVGNTFSNKKTVSLSDVNLTVAGSMNSTAGSITVQDSNITVNGGVTSKGTLSIKDSTFTAGGAFTNTGKLILDAQTTFTVGSFSGATGQISVDLSKETADAIKLIDTTSSANLTLDNVGTVSLNNDKYSLLIYDNDLYAFNSSVIKINSTWDEDTILPIGCIWEVNAFRDIGNASRVIKGGTVTYEYTYSNEEDCDVTGTFTITPNSGTPSVTFKHGDTLLASTTVSSKKTQEIAMVSGETYTIDIVGDSTLYSIGATFMGNSVNPKPDLDFTIEDSSYAGYGIAEEEFLFEVAPETSGFFTVSISGASKRVSYRVVNKATGKKISYGSTTSAVSRDMELTEGTYALVVCAYKNTSHQYDTDYNISITGTVNSDVRSEDDDWILNDTAGDLQVLSLGHNVDGFVGLGDVTDYMHLDISHESGIYSFYLETEEDTDSSGLRFYLTSVSGSNETTVASASFRGNQSSPIISNVLLDGTQDYFIHVTVPYSASSSYNSTYTVKLQKGEENLMISDEDDSWNSTAVQDSPYTGGTYRNWIGTEDTVDWVKIDANTFTGTHAVTFTSDGYRILCTISKKTSMGAMQSIGSVNVYDGGEEASTNITFAANTEYYFRLSCGSSSNISSHYTMCVA